MCLAAVARTLWRADHSSALSASVHPSRRATGGQRPRRARRCEPSYGMPVAGVTGYSGSSTPGTTGGRRSSTRRRSPRRSASSSPGPLAAGGHGTAHAAHCAAQLPKLLAPDGRVEAACLARSSRRVGPRRHAARRGRAGGNRSAALSLSLCRLVVHLFFQVWEEENSKVMAAADAILVRHIGRRRHPCRKRRATQCNTPDNAGRQCATKDNTVQRGTTQCNVG